ncbi:MAG: DUF87 domain-containing protein [Candidatus Thermoplasmatota archaeon]|nr:DUF87 domain-containing protein [Candidatus Thermoplasmatota archaeon]
MVINISDGKTRKGSISEKLYVLGRREKAEGGILNIGRYYALDKSLGSNVYVDGAKPHVILICGKRGYGKSYTMGTFIEEISLMDESIRKNIGVVVIDTLGIYWTSFFENKKQEGALSRWGCSPTGLKIKVLSSPDSVNEYRKKGIDAEKFSLRTSEITPSQWCQLFGAELIEPLGVAVARAINEMDIDYSIDDIIAFIKKDRRTRDEIKGAGENFFNMAKSWNVFDREGLPLDKIVKNGEIMILDISLFSEELKIIIVAVLSRKIFERRVRERKKDEERIMEHRNTDETSEKIFPMVCMAIDEAQVFLPYEKKISKDVLIKQWMRQGRQPGLSLVLATQRPSALDPEVLSHSDIIICHRLTAQEDIDALNKVRPTYMQGEISEALKKVGAEKGVALIIDDTSESVHIIKIRPRLSWHGGEEPSAMVK